MINNRKLDGEFKKNLFDLKNMRYRIKTGVDRKPWKEFNDGEEYKDGEE